MVLNQRPDMNKKITALDLQEAMKSLGKQTTLVGRGGVGGSRRWSKNSGSGGW